MNGNETKSTRAKMCIEQKASFMLKWNEQNKNELNRCSFLIDNKKLKWWKYYRRILLLLLYIFHFLVLFPHFFFFEHEYAIGIMSVYMRLSKMKLLLFCSLFGPLPYSLHLFSNGGGGGGVSLCNCPKLINMNWTMAVAIHSTLNLSIALTHTHNAII